MSRLGASISLLRRLPLGLMALTVGLSGCVQMGPLKEHRATGSVQSIAPELSSRLSRGELALANGRVSEAQDSFVSAVQVSSGDPRAVLGLAESHLARGDHKRAKQLLDQIKSGNDVPSARLDQAMGIVALRSDQPDRARRLFERSVDADASLWRAWIGLGRVHLMTGRNDDARSAFVMAEQTAPQSASAQNDVGMAHLRLENTRTAIEHFERALQIDPAHSLAKANLRIVRAMQGDYRSAVLGVTPDRQHHAYNNVGYAALMRGEYDLADRYLRRAIELSPTHHRIAAANLELLPE